MPLYRKKPVTIEAFRLGHQQPPAHFDRDLLHIHPEGHALIHTLEGTMLANKGDWIIKGVSGELYPCKDHIFRATYDLAEDDQPSLFPA